MPVRLPHVSPCAEFPTDNPGLHSGVTWRTTSVVGYPRAILRALQSSIPRVEEPAPPDPAPCAFEAFLEALVAVLLSAGATRAAAALPALLRSGKIEEPLAAVPLLRSDELHATLAAWRAVLAGTSCDLSACGASTLDRWAAELLGVVLGAPPARIEELRRELRRRGVAAFGMLDAA